MPSVMAIVSKAVFEKSSPGAQTGEVLDTERYQSTHAALSPLADGGDLYLVTVRPPDERLWLVAVLRHPKKDANGWAATNAAPVRDLSALRSSLRFANGKGLSAKVGALGMSLQTPRTLAEEDVAALEKLIGTETKAVAKTAKAPEKPTVQKPTVQKPIVQKPVVKGASKPLALDFAGLSTTALRDAVLSLEKSSADPAIAAALVGLLDAPAYTSRFMTPMWTSLFEQLAGTQAFRSNIAALRGVDLSRSFGSTNMGGWMKRRMDELIKNLCKQFPEGAKDAPAARAKASVETKPASGSEAELLAMIAANPDDDGPRLVYGDFVAERGDAARAEFIQLQIARGKGGEPSEREVALLKKHAKTWLAPLLPVLHKDSWFFERGFLDECTIYPRKAGAIELAGHPLWSTVRDASLSETGDAAPIITHPVMRNLRVVRVWTYPRGLLGLLNSDAPVEEIHDIYLPNVTRDKALWAAFIGCKRLPKLRLLEISGATIEAARAIWNGSLDRPGMRFFLSKRNGFDLPDWILAAVQERPARASLTFKTHHLEIEHQGDGVILTIGPNPLRGLEDAAMALGAYYGREEGLPKGLLRVVLRVPPGGIVGSYPQGKLPTAKAVLGTIEQACAKRGASLSVEEGVHPLAYPSNPRSTD